MGDELLLDLHELVEIAEGHLRLDHPELLEMAAGLALFGAEGGAEAVDLAEGEDVGLVVQLAGLGQIRGLTVIVDREERGGAFGRGRREDGRVDVDVTVAVQPLADGLDDHGAHAHGRPLARRAQPEMAVLHEKLHAVLFGRDRVRLGHLMHGHVRHVDLVAAGYAGRTLVGLDRAGHDDAALLGQVADFLEDIGRHVALEDHRLADAGTVAHLQKEETPLAGLVVKPALE